MHRISFVNQTSSVEIYINLNSENLFIFFSSTGNGNSLSRRKKWKEETSGEPPDKERVASAKAQSSVYDESLSSALKCSNRPVGASN